MALLACWVAYPLVLVLLAYGAGALVQLASGRRLALGVRVPCGLALVIALLDLCTRTTATAPLAVGVTVAVGAAGLVVALVLRLRDPDGAAPLRPSAGTLAGVLAALGVFAAYAAPIVLSGEATWAGYFKLDDTANWLALVAQALAHGHSYAGVPPSAYQAVFTNYLVNGYPLGSFLPLGIGHALLGQDLAWLTDPWMAVMAATLGLALSYVAERALPRAPAWQPGIIGALAALSALLYGYYLWGGMKELADAFLIATFAASLPLVLDEKARVRAAIPAVVALWALIAAESPGGLVWVGPGALVALGLLAWRGRWPAWTAFGEPPPAASAVAVGAAPVATAIATEATATASPAAKPAKPKAGGPGPGKAKSGGRSQAAPARTGAKGRGRGGPAPSLATTRRRKGAAADARRAGPRGPARWREALEGTRARLPGREWLRSTSPTIRRLAIAAVVMAVCGLLLALRPGGWVQTFEGVLTAGGSLGLGDLHAPLNPLQIVGIWPTGDFRNAASPLWLTYVLIAVALIGALAGLIALVRQRRLEAVLYVACAITGAVIVDALASPWLGGKALAAASPAVPFAALVAAVLLARRRRAVGIGLGVIVVAGVLWSDGLGYHGVWLAPRAQMAELITVEKHIAGQGPTLVPDPEVYAVRYFLGGAAAESPGELRSRTDPLSDGQTLPTGGYADLDQLSLGAVLQYPTIVLHRSPANSRPPYGYNLTYQGRYWQVWQRSPDAKPPILSYAPLGSVVAPGSVPVCSNISQLARVPGVQRLVAAPVQNPIIASTAGGSQPAAWTDPDYPTRYSDITGTGTARFPVQVTTAGRYDVWLGGELHALTSLSIDGHLVGSVRDDIQRNGQYIDFGSVTLSAGTHMVTLQRPGGQLLDPGSGGGTDVVGPLELAPDVPMAPLLTVPVSAASTLCGRTLDWIEGLGS